MAKTLIFKSYQSGGLQMVIVKPDGTEMPTNSGKLLDYALAEEKATFFHRHNNAPKDALETEILAKINAPE